MSSCQSCRGRSTRKKPGRFCARADSALDQLQIPHHAQDALAANRDPEPWRTKAQIIRQESVWFASASSTIARSTSSTGG